MSTQEKYFELITAYLKNEMSASEVKAFEENLSTNTELQEEFNFQVNLQQAWKENSNAQLKEQFRGLEKTLQSGKETPAKNKFVSLWPHLAVAASILLLAGFFLFNNNSNNQDIYETYFSDYPNELVKIERGEQDLAQENQKAFILYSEKKYAQALNAFEKLDLEGLELYKAICFMNLANYEKAMLSLDKIDLATLVEYKNQVAWYKALCQIKLGNQKAAKKHLQSIIDGNGSFRKKSAHELILELK